MEDILDQNGLLKVAYGTVIKRDWLTYSVSEDKVY